MGRAARHTGEPRRGPSLGALAALVLLTLVLATPTAAYADPIPEWLPKYDLEIQLEPAARSIRVRQLVTWTNRHARPTDELVFSAYARYKIPDEDVVLLAKTLELLRSAPSDGIDFKGHRLQLQRVTLCDGCTELPHHWRSDMHTCLVVKLPRIVAQGESITVAIDFTVDLPDKEGRWGQRDGLTYLANWYPVLAYYDDDGWQPTPFIAWHQPFFNEAGVYTARLICPEPLKVACTGTIVRQVDLGDGRKRVEIVAAAARDFTLVCCSCFQEWTAKVDHVTVHVLADPQYAWMAEKALQFACEVIPLYNQWFGPYPFEDFYIAQSRFAWNGNQNAGIVMIDERVFSMPNLMVKYMDHLISHETLHQWWWNVVGVNGYSETFMDEAVACFYTARRLQRKYGHNAPLLEYPLPAGVARLLPNVHHEDYRFYGLYGTLARREETRTVQPLDQFGNLVVMFSMTYDRGAKVLGMIEDRIGEAAFYDFMKIVYSKYQFRILRVADFQRELEAYTGFSWQDFFDRWLYGVGGSDWEVASVELRDAAVDEPLADATGALTPPEWPPPIAPSRLHRVTVRLEQRAEFTEPTWLGVKFEGSEGYDLRVPIRLAAEPEIVTADGCGVDGRVMRAARIETSPDGRAVTVMLLLPRRPTQITVDPDQILLDKQPANNHWRPEVSWRLRAVMTNLDETDLTTAYDRWNIVTGPWLGLNQPQFGQRPYAGFRAAAYRLQTFTGGTYVAWDAEDMDLRAGADAIVRRWPWPQTEVGMQFDHSLTSDWASLKRDRGRLFGRYIINETPSLYLDPIEFAEVYARAEQAFDEDSRFIPQGVTNYDSFAAVGLRYFRNYLTPYWNPEGGYRLDTNYELGLPILGAYDSVYNRVQAEVSFVKTFPEWTGPLTATRLALRVYGGAGFPQSGYHFQLGGPTRFRGFNRNDREGDALWVLSAEWRFPLWQSADIDFADRIVRIKHIWGATFWDGGEIYLRGQPVGWMY
ncbi:MAG TPA: M1 family aminopeptidase, partial [Gemmatales bacterium]|nr:M1 family aminopeptidase [Gemmatales bacterium]